MAALFAKVQGTDGPPPPAEPPRPRGTWTVWIGLAAAAVLTWWSYGGSRSPAMRIGLPGGTHAANAVTGDTLLYNGDFYRARNLGPLKQLDLIKGNDFAGGGSAVKADPRIGYAVLANLLTIGLEPPQALSGFNLLLCLLAAWLVGRVSRTLFDDRAKSNLAVALFVSSVAATLLVGDPSPHLLDLVVYYLWSFRLLQIEAAAGTFSRRSLVGLSAFLGGWSLVSTSSLFGLATLVILLLRRRRVLGIVLPLAACYLIPHAEREILSRLGIGSLPELQGTLAWEGLQAHWHNLCAAPARYVSYLAVELANELFNDNPVNLAIAAVGLTFLRHPRKRLLALLWLVPIGVSLVFLPTTDLRGAAVAGNTIVVFAVVSHYAVDASRDLRRTLGERARAAAVPIVALLGLQMLWGHGAFFGWHYPAGAFATGIFKNSGLVPPTDFVPMSGPLSQKPTVVGGTVSACVSYGLAEDFGRRPVFPVERLAPYRDHWSGWPRLATGLQIQALFLGCLSIAGFSSMPLRRSFLAIPLFAACTAGAQLFGSASGFDEHIVRTFDERIAVKEDEKLVARVRLSTEFRDLLEQAALENARVEFAIPFRGRSGSVDRATGRDVEWQVEEWTSDEPRFAVPAQAFVDALAAHDGCVEVSLRPKAGSRGVFVHSWQALGSPEELVASDASLGRRDAAIIRADGSSQPLRWFPSFELRVVRGDNEYPFKSLIERFDRSRPTGYVLIGY